MKTTKASTTRQKMEVNAHNYNKYLTPAHLKALDLISVLRNTHPIDRKDFARDLHNEGKISG